MDAVLRVVVLTAIYLLVLTSLHPGDVLTGLVLSVLLVVAGRRIRPLGPPVDEPLPRRLAGVPGLIGGTLVDLPASTWRTALWCLSPRRTTSGLVTVPIPPCHVRRRLRRGGCGSGLTPDTVVVELDEERGGCCCT